MVEYQKIWKMLLMGRSKAAVPAYLEHKATGQARIIWNGKTVYLGKFGSLESQVKYQQMLAYIIATGDVEPDSNAIVSIATLASRFILAMQAECKPGSKEPAQMQLAIRDLVQLYGETDAVDFKPGRLMALRTVWIDRPLARSSINMYHSYIVRCFQWGVEHELVHVEVWESLKAVRKLAEHRARKATKVVDPVDWENVIAIKDYCGKIIWDMIQIQWLTGMRAGELVLMSPSTIDQQDWSYRPPKHKTEYKGKKRIVFLGPKSREIIIPYLSRETHKYLFSPSEAQQERFRVMRENRKTKVQPSQQDRSLKKPQRTPGDHYTTGSYGRAIASACKKAGIKPWSSHQLRHAAATRIRAEYGLEEAQAVLGHSSAKITEVYAEVNFAKAKNVADKSG